MDIKELIKQLKMIQKNHKDRKINIKIGSIEGGKYSEDILYLQNIVESNYDGKTTVILMK